jgi:CRISPR/Cas system CMR-associated protein Cmr5 small subunit
MKAVNKLLGAADAAIKKSTFLKEGNKIDEIYKNYAAQFCVSVVQAGLLPAFAYFYEDTDSKEGESSYILEAIAKTLEYKSKEALWQEILTLANNRPAARQLKQKMIHAAIALKIMMKTYTIIQKEKNESI